MASLVAVPVMGLHVSYAPMSSSFLGGCSTGEVVVGTETFFRGQQRNVQRMVDCQPQM